MYAVFLMVLRCVCYDFGWNLLARKISAHKFKLFPELRRWQINKWVGQFQRQNLFPNATESQLKAWAEELVRHFMI